MATSTIGSTGTYSRIDLWLEAKSGTLTEVEIGEHQDESITHSTNQVLWGTDATFTCSPGAYYRHLRPVAGAYYDPATASGAASLWNGNASAVIIAEGGAICEGIALKNNNTNGAATTLELRNNQATGTDNTDVMRVRRMVLDGQTTQGYVVRTSGVATGTAHDVYFYNSITLTSAAGDGQYGIGFTQSCPTGNIWVIANHTVADIDTTGSFTGDGVHFDGGTNNGTVLVENIAVYGSTGNDFDAMASLSGTHTEDYNASEDTTAAGANSVTGLAPATDFVDEANGDWTPASGGALEDAGVSLSSYFTDDFYGNTRSGTWDIGAIERATAGGQTVNASPISGGAAVAQADADFKYSPAPINNAAATVAGSNIDFAYSPASISAAAALAQLGSLDLAYSPAAISAGAAVAQADAAFAYSPAPVTFGAVVSQLEKIATEYSPAGIGQVVVVQGGAAFSFSPASISAGAPVPSGDVAFHFDGGAIIPGTGTVTGPSIVVQYSAPAVVVGPVVAQASAAVIFSTDAAQIIQLDAVLADRIQAEAELADSIRFDATIPDDLTLN